MEILNKIFGYTKPHYHGHRNNKLFNNHGQRQYIYDGKGNVKKIIYHDI